MLTPRDRKILFFGLPAGIVAAVLIDLLFFATVAPTFLQAGPPGATPLGTALALSAPSEVIGGGEHWYNFSVTAAGSGLQFSDLSFQVDDATGGIDTSTGGWIIVAIQPPGQELDAYQFSNSAWFSGGGEIVHPTDILALNTGSVDLGGQGQLLVVTGSAGFDGTITVSIA